MACDPEDRPALHTIPAELFQKLQLKEIEPWWLNHGVLEYEPDPSVAHRDGVWTYITTGLSNPWGITPDKADPKSPSGLGIELMMRTEERAPWAIRVLQWLSAMQILQGMGRVQGELVQDGMVVPLFGPIDPSRPDTPVRYLVLVHAIPDCPRHQLASGWFELLLALGITEDDRNAMLADEGERLLEVWQRTNGVTCP
jgi:glycine/D-amino acid oxidase-like deaminating enzyme